MATKYTPTLRTQTFKQKQIAKDRRLAIDYWHEKGISENELLKVHRTLAKRSNQRLVRLERAVSEVTGESYASYGAGDIAKEYLQKQGVNRFTENAKSNYKLKEEQQSKNQLYDRKQILQDIKKMQEFLLSPSSTVGQQKAIEKARIKTFETEKVVNGEVIRKPIEFASNKEFYDFLSSQTFKELTATFNSETLVEVYDEARREKKTHDEIVDALSDYRDTQNQSVKGLRDRLGLKAVT